MDFLGYPSINEIEVNNTEDYNVVDSQYDSNELFKKLDKSINQLSSKIRYDQLKLYRAYRLCDNNICAVWVRSNTIEIELYMNKKDVRDYKEKVYDISNRKRGNRLSAIKIISEEDIAIAINIIKQIIDKRK